MGAEHIQTVEGRALPLRGEDIDTDRIMPARFLKSITFEGLDAHVFEDDRLEAKRSGRLHPFDEPTHQGASILVANRNFGTGSSREHAPQGLRRWGIRAIVAESFAEIFFGNSTAIGLPCVTGSAKDLGKLMDRAEAQPNETFALDLQRGTLTGTRLSLSVEMPASARDALLSGTWDATGLLLADYAQVEQVGARLPYPGFETAAGH